ncbi:MAG TPA: hypothetical protein PKK43_12150, partial [Spirochaetota bacterium]|nr:hypothetical protein [Spirochaetota bacterium]
SGKKPYEIVTYQDVLTPYMYSIIDNGFKLIVDFKSPRFIIDRTDINDKPSGTVTNERKRISFLKRQIEFFSMTTKRNNYTEGY